MLAVMTEISTRLGTITGLQVTDLGYPGKVGRVPAALIYPPDRIEFDQTYGRGMDTFDDVIVVILVGRGTNRQMIKDISPYLAGTGTKSIKAKLDVGPATPYTSCADVQVQWAELDPAARLTGTDYMAALFHLKIIGLGN